MECGGGTQEKLNSKLEIHTRDKFDGGKIWPKVEREEKLQRVNDSAPVRQSGE